MHVWKTTEEVTRTGTVQSIQAFIRTRMGRFDGNMQYANVWVKNVFAVTMRENVHQKRGEQIVQNVVNYNNGEADGAKEKHHLKKLWIRVQGEGSCFCGNFRGHHESNSVYFEMGPRRCWQRCFCTDDTVRTSGKTCKDYSASGGGGRELSNELLALFTTVITKSGSIPAMPPAPKGNPRKPSTHTKANLRR